jgi:uncharacterized protein
MRLLDNKLLFSATDLSSYLACQHLTQLTRQVVFGEIKRPEWKDPSLAILAERGEKHEQDYLDYLNGLQLTVKRLNWESVDATVKAMRNGYDIIAQARLQQGPWMGYADILRKIPVKSSLGDWSYEVVDTKLSANTKAASMLQLCLYTELLAFIQGIQPENMFIVKPGDPFETEKYRFADFQAYYRHVKRSFETTLQHTPAVTYPNPVEHCNICDWWQVCDRKREADDHLSLVAGIRKTQIGELATQEIDTLASFAEAARVTKPSRGSFESLLQKKAQAELQLEGRKQRKLLHKAFHVTPSLGLARLPRPDAGDVYFDIEGDPFYADGGLEYLLGYVYRHDNQWHYESIWAKDRHEERKAFEKFMAFVMDRWKKFPGMYIYHFAPYEPSAIKRLARVHATFESEVDQLLRAERFIDLHTVFKEGLLASVRRYSLKELEKLTDYTRIIPLPEASAARKNVEVALEAGDFDSKAHNNDTVERYNEDDCRATLALHEWLEDVRNELVSVADSDALRPELKAGEATEQIIEFETRAEEIRNVLIRQLPDDRNDWTEEDKARWLLAHEVEYFRRESKSAFWDYYRVHELDHDDLLDERSAITGLQFITTLPPQGRDRMPTHRYSFPEQDVSARTGRDAIEVRGAKIGTIVSIDNDQHIIDIKKTGKTRDVHPTAIHFNEWVDPKLLTESLLKIANAVCDDGFDRTWGFGVGKDLLLKRPPTLQGGKRIADFQHKELHDTAVSLAMNLLDSVLAIQGPPGSGKTHLGANMIATLAKAGKKIGVTAVSHKVIRNLLDKVQEFSNINNDAPKLVHKTKPSDTPPKGITEVKGNKDALAAIGEGTVVGGTAWLWAIDDAEGMLDYLFVDEAGQMSLSTVLATSRAAKNLILLGDPQQLEQPQRGAHPEGSDVAALTHLLDGHATIPRDKGIFLEKTYRLHPAICNFTSELYYEGRLRPAPKITTRVVSGTRFDGAGLFYVPVIHTGNQSSAVEEVAAVQSLVSELAGKAKWTNEHGQAHVLTQEDILIIAPYNAQVIALKEALPTAHIGTVDKFQGQEAPVVIYSMTSSSAEDAPRGMGFLYNPHRLNVATSRAKSVCILVASPALLEPWCHNIDHMRWANGLCRYAELAKQVESVSNNR